MNEQLPARYPEGVRQFDRIAGLTVTTMSALASSALLIWMVRTPGSPGDVVWPFLLAVSLITVNAWIGVWAWFHELWWVAAPTVFIGALGAVGLMSILAVVPMGFAVCALVRAIRRRVRTA